jgi:energy-coupling factor transporter ATP-binding protein EcfA2
LNDQSIHFSPNMNCIIGGRGSGKSTLLEYLRIIFRKDRSADIDTDTRTRIERIKNTLDSAGAVLEVVWVNADGVEDRIIWKSGQPIVVRDDMPDPEAFFDGLPIQFFSQQQLNRLTEAKKSDEGQIPQAQRLLDLINGFATHELSMLMEQEKKLIHRIENALACKRRADEVSKGLRKYQQEYQELDRQWKARSEIQPDALKHQKLKDESRYLDLIDGVEGVQFSDVIELANSVVSSHQSFEIDSSPHESWFKQYDNKVKAVKEKTALLIQQAVHKYYSDIETLRVDDANWIGIKHELEHADSNFVKACEVKGLTTADVGHLKEIELAKANKFKEITEHKTELEKLTAEADTAAELIQQLHLIWQQQYQIRVAAAINANELAVLAEGNRKFIEVTVQYQFDQITFFRLWSDFGPKDGRTALARAWADLGKKLLDEFAQIPDEARTSPWQFLRDLYFIKQGEGANQVFPQHADSLKQYIIDNREHWDHLRLKRVKDVVDLTLFRSDGSEAGSISKGSLSDGQRNTAALALLLAQQGGPLVIDQPEDELDSNFVFKELIPMLRKVKSNRQIILATHNANLPVNGDAELVYALEAKDGKGVKRAEGGLDKSEVTAAVLDIMEGTEEAFRRRREKYHF